MPSRHSHLDFEIRFQKIKMRPAEVNKKMISVFICDLSRQPLPHCSLSKRNRSQRVITLRASTAAMAAAWRQGKQGVAALEVATPCNKAGPGRMPGPDEEIRWGSVCLRRRVPELAPLPRSEGNRRVASKLAAAGKHDFRHLVGAGNHGQPADRNNFV